MRGHHSLCRSCWMKSGQQPAALDHALTTECNASAICTSTSNNPAPVYCHRRRAGTPTTPPVRRYLIEITTPFRCLCRRRRSSLCTAGKLDFRRRALRPVFPRSGESTDVNIAWRSAPLWRHNHGHHHVIGSPLSQTADHVILLHAGDETSVPPPNLDLAAPHDDLLVGAWRAPLSARYDIARIPRWGAVRARLRGDIAERARAYTFAEKAIVVGRGFNYCNALRICPQADGGLLYRHRQVSRRRTSCMAPSPSRARHSRLRLRAARANMERHARKWWRNSARPGVPHAHHR